jgi:hypothetical protein
MNGFKHNIKIVSEKFGDLLNESFIDPTQFKLFLKMVHGCIELKNDLTFFNGVDFMIHIPYKYLCDSIVMTSLDEVSIVDQVRSKVEALVTK